MDVIFRWENLHLYIWQLSKIVSRKFLWKRWDDLFFYTEKVFFRKLSILRIRTYKDIFSYLKLDVDGSFNVVADSIEHIIISQVSGKFMWAFDLNCLKPPNGCCFRKSIVFINVFNPHKISVLNRLTPAPSSMPFISNFDFSYPKCHAFGLHCRYYWFRSSCLLDRNFL